MDMSVLAGLTATAERALNGYLDLDPQSRARLAALEGGVVALQVDGLGQTLFFVPGEDRMQVMLRFDARPDTLIRGSPLALARLGIAGETTRLPEGVHLEGDARLGQQFRDLLRAVDLDWEEWLSRLTGDMLAHQAGEIVRGLGSWARHAGDSLSADVAEYLREESGALPARDQVEEFMDAVDRLREDLDRLEARVGRLEHFPGGAGS